MQTRSLIALVGAILILAACGGDRTVGRAMQSIPLVGGLFAGSDGARAGTLIGRLMPVQRASVRGHPPRPRIGPHRAGALCGIRGIEGEPIAPITSQVTGCGVANPVRVTHVDGVRLTQGAIMDCETAAALHQWVTRGVRPAVGRQGGGVEALRVSAHYTCRPRNHRAGARISEHGRGRAIDISGIILANGDEMSVLRDWSNSPHSRALRQMHRAACGTFGTTLGPGSDGMHEDHFHYDTARHRNGPYCR